MIDPSGDFIVCDQTGCDEKIKNHKWGQIKAVDWFFQKNGQAWCPAHVPDWYASWGKRKKK